MSRGLIVAGALLAPMLAVAAVKTNGPVAAYGVVTNAAGNRSHLFDLAPEGRVEVTPYAPDVVRVRFHFASLYDREEPAIAKPFDAWPAFPCTQTLQGMTNLLLETDHLVVAIAMSNRFRVAFQDKQGGELLGDIAMEYDDAYHQIDDTNGYAQVAWPEGSTSVSNRPAGFKLRAVKPMEAGDAFFGLGDYSGPLNRRGHVIQGWSQDTFAFGEFRTPRYTTLPMLHGIRTPTAGVARAYGLFFHNPARPVFDLGGTTQFTFEAGDDHLDYFFFGGGSNHTSVAVLDRYAELTGRPALWPKWAHGYHQSRHSYDTQDKVHSLANALRAQSIPCDAIYLDIDTQNSFGGARQQLTFNTAFTNIPLMASFCTNLGLRLVPIVEPCLLTNDPLYPEALSNLYFLKRNDLSTYVGSNFLGRISWLDFSITNTAAWWTERVGQFLTNGFEAIWNDLNEPNENDLPLDTLWYLDGRYGGGLVTNDTRKWHAVNKNTYSLLEARLSFNTLRQQVPAKRPFVLSRSAWPGIAPYAAGWSGDNVSSFDHLRFNVRLGTSVMVSGQPTFGHDVGGFVGDAQAELLTRWIQAGALTPFFRNHTLNGTADQEPWVFGEPYTLWNRRWIEFRYRLMPYLYSLFHACSSSGVPANLPVPLLFPADTNTWAQNECDFMVGSHLLAAPVVVSNATTRSVYLPAGTTWHAWQNDERIAGGQTPTRAASLGTLPLYVRAGAIVPMGPLQQFANEMQPAWLEFHVWPGTNQFELYEDDGETTNHLAGAYAKTPLAVAGNATNLTFSIGARVGSYATGVRSLFVVVHALSNVVAVTLDGLALPRGANRTALATNGWCYSTTDHLLTVRIADDPSARIVGISGNAATPNHPAYTSAFSNVAVAGTMNYWDEAARNMRLVSNGRWVAVLDLSGLTNTEFKFVANDQWTAGNWGDSAQAAATPPLSDVADPGGNNILLSGSLTGLFTFVFNEGSLAYAVAPASSNDSDGDGLTDAWEMQYGLDPAGAGDAALDLDGDRISNADEFVAGTHPTDIQSYLAVASATPATSGVAVGWMAVTGRSYRLYASTNLPAAADWQPLLPFTNVTGAGPVTVTDTNGLGARHYRIGVVP